LSLTHRWANTLSRITICQFPGCIYKVDTKLSANKRNLEFLLQYLICPADGLPELKMIRNADDQVIGLPSKNHEYPVIDNIPNMMPGNAFRLDPAWNHWENLLQKWNKSFGSQFDPQPSAENDPVTGHIREKITSGGASLCLDVGCGTTTWTPYMAACDEEVRWIRIFCNRAESLTNCKSPRTPCKGTPEAKKSSTLRFSRAENLGCLPPE
jgi:uncharacterized protein YbaR (Trm112 family)